MKMNKACDLSSISVLPPQLRRSGVSCSLPEMSSTLRHSQAPSQQQQQRSQRSFSQPQGISSQQNATFSQFSQNSQDETLTSEHQNSLQLVVSQERENSVKRFSCLPPVNHTREESQMQLSRSSTGLISKWGSGVPEQRCQMSQDLEHRIGTIESSLSRFGKMLESLQTDIMQVNKGTKELALDMESIRQKLIGHDSSLQIIHKGQDDVKATLHGELKLISDQLNQNTCHQNSQDIPILLSSLQEKIGVFISNLRNDLSKSFTNEMQALGCKLKELEQKNPTPNVLPPRPVSHCVSPQGMFPLKKPVVPPKVQPATQVPKVEMGTWHLVKRDPATLKNRDYSKEHKSNRVSQIELSQVHTAQMVYQRMLVYKTQDREFRVIIDSDEDVDGGFTFFPEENETGRYLAEKAKEETERLLRKARRRKRKYCNPIIIN